MGVHGNVSLAPNIGPAKTRNHPKPAFAEGFWYKRVKAQAKMRPDLGLANDEDSKRIRRRHRRKLGGGRLIPQATVKDPDDRGGNDCEDQHEAYAENPRTVFRLFSGR
jgi:hypothetical protein